MDIFDSSWLVSMLEKSSASSQQRLLNLFVILGDWLQAPHIRENINLNAAVTTQPPSALLQYLAEQSRSMRSQAPDILAHQLYCMALVALQQELQSPGCNAFMHAQQAAQALINSQTEQKLKLGRPVYGLAASLAIIASLIMLFGIPQQQSSSPMHTVDLNAIQLPPVAPHAIAINPANTAAMYASLEQMRSGVCHYPEALMLPEAQQSVYLQNVVGGQVFANAMDQALAAKLMQRVHCNYAPMLMKHSTG